MARRRYLSTTISTDKAVNRLAMQYGDFAALLYTWLIPHAADDCSFPADPEELMMIVMPGRRDKEPEDIQTAIDAMLTEGLIVHDPDDRDSLIFPPDSFYRHQPYIKGERRRKAPDAAPTQDTSDPSPDSAQISENLRTSPDSAQPLARDARASFSVSSSSSVSHSHSDGGDPPNPPAAINPAYVAFAGICEAQGTDPHVLDNASLRKQIKHTALLLGRGETAETLSACAGWMASQGWRDGGIDAFSVGKALPGWKLKGCPAVAQSRASPRRGGARNGEKNGNDWAREIAEAEARERQRGDETHNGRRGDLAELPAW